MKGPRVLWLIRHLQIDDSPGQMIGWTDLPLSDPASADQYAAAYLPLIQRGAVVYTSDLKRAVQTATPLAKALNCPMETTDELREINFGRWEGLTWPEIEKKDPAAYGRMMENWMTERMPGGESTADQMVRLQAFWERVRHLHTGQTIVVVGHGGSLRPLAGIILGQTVETVMAKALNRGNAIRIERKTGINAWDINPLEK